MTQGLRTSLSVLGILLCFTAMALGQGRDAVKQLIEDNPELMDDLERKIKEQLAGVEEKKVLEEKE